MTKVTFENLLEVEALIERAVDFLEDKVVPIVQIQCNICGRMANIKDLEDFAKGAVPLPDPFPLGARVVRKGLGWRGSVTENRIIALSGEGHRHRRLLTIEPNDGSGRSFCQIEVEEGIDMASPYFVLESEWETQQQGRGGGK